MTPEELDEILKKLEDFDLEFKEAKNSYSESSAKTYCAAISNGKGGKLLLGVNNQREIIGTNAYLGSYPKLPNKIYGDIGIIVEVFEVIHKKGRVLVFNIPQHPTGKLIKAPRGSKYTYPIRLGESLDEMPEERMKEILNESVTDFSAKMVKGLKTSDLDTSSISKLRSQWARKVERPDFEQLSDAKVLSNLGLYFGGELTYAALILLGKSEIIRKYLPDSEIIFEWRQNPNKTSHDFRKTWRDPFINAVDDIWDTINKRNLRTPFQKGFIQDDIYAFDRKSIREAVMNAVIHRDYSIKGESIFIQASPNEFKISSPGSFMPGITPTNILNERAWRNRLIAETLEKAGLVERSGQGVDDIYYYTITSGKGIPDYSDSNIRHVILSIPAKIKDLKFISYLIEVAKEKNIEFTAEEVLELEKVRVKNRVANLAFKEKFLNLGIIERTGHGKGTKYILSHKYYKYTGKPGTFTRISGIKRDRAKELILNHIAKNDKGFLDDFEEVLTELTNKDISNILQALKKEGKIYYDKKKQYWRMKKLTSPDNIPLI